MPQCSDKDAKVVVALAHTAVILGGLTWEAIPKLFDAVPAAIHDAVVEDFRMRMIVMFKAVIGDWICRNLGYLEK